MPFYVFNVILHYMYIIVWSVFYMLKNICISYFTMHTIWWWNVPVLKTAPGVFKNCIMLKWLVFYANCILKVFQSLWNARTMYNMYGLMHYIYMCVCLYRCAFVSFTKINRILEKRNLIISFSSYIMYRNPSILC